MKIHRSPRNWGMLSATLIALVAVPSSAHHSAAPFDMSKDVVVTGTVEKWMWSNPHSWLYLRRNKGKVQEVWGFEGGSSGMLARSGWNSNDMKVGDRVTVTAHPSRDGKTVGLISEIKLANGKVLGGGAGAAPPAPGYRPN